MTWCQSRHVTTMKRLPNEIRCPLSNVSISSFSLQTQEYIVIINMSKNISKNRHIYNSWIDMQKIIGDASKWPKNIRKLFWTRGVKHFDRILLATFVIVNGVNPVMFTEWARLLDLGNDEAAYRHLRLCSKSCRRKVIVSYMHSTLLITGTSSWMDMSDTMSMLQKGTN